MAKYMDYPFQVDSRGRTGITNRNDHVRDMIEQVLFTNPGERVNRPDFGCGLLQMVFGSAGDALVSTVQYSLHGALQHWLGDIIEVKEVIARQEESRLSVQVVYVRLNSGEIVTDNFRTE